VNAATLLSKVQAHEGSTWALDARPDGKGFASGGGDKEVKFWEFELVDGADGKKQLSLVVAKCAEPLFLAWPPECVGTWLTTLPHADRSRSQTTSCA
jgi:hypothetical protein